MLIAKPCTSMGGVLVQLYLWDKEVKIEISKLAQELKQKGYKIKTLIPGIMVVTEIDGYEASIYPSGKIIIKDLRDEKKAEEIARKIYDLAGVNIED
ncbi:hypothetical protein PFDSM3638_02320 [Pyrococcus furiosus DSM 3638]|uniref:Uncharacterized protein n=3 Tax=Pyrococcus furiosus TaxID=2261 RepID=Q8U3K0_PYRFU|nr:MULTISPECIES: hypothetical protein [Pyrococcus]AAL80590.1 hypothetical protein PF0466 [Pyrococcus furiosus DSM 3638]AFN03260.1 hypothetical protein PFC_01445 [Pyrococcus furiosus COM1]MDK2869341.1 hypothetical protein [Pyrococcus sp.]QEK78179.1 hypothetical protein PFDSM3638_02320 [Pyrococcus furiosus DSM 3638]